MGPAKTVDSFQGKVLRDVAYRHSRHVPIPPTGSEGELAFQAVQFSFGHSRAYVLHRAEGLSIEPDFDEHAEVGESCWVLRTRFDNWRRLQGVRIVSAELITNPGDRSQQLVLGFGDGTEVRLEPTVVRDETSEFWPAPSRLLRISFRIAGRRKKTGDSKRRDEPDSDSPEK